MWYGEVKGVLVALTMSTDKPKRLVLTDSSAAISAIKNAGERKKARTKDLAELVRRWHRREEQRKATRIAGSKLMWGLRETRKPTG